MENSWASALSRHRRLSNHVTTTNDNQDFRPTHFLSGAEIVTFLPLQIALYFNVYYSPLWLISSVFSLLYKFSELPEHYKVIIVIVHLFVAFVEISRLYLGYEGNLKEKIRALVVFWLLSIMQVLLTVILCLLGHFGALLFPLETVAHVVILAFLCVQLLLGFRALQLMFRAQAVKFHLSHYRRCGVEELPMIPIHRRKLN